MATRTATFAGFLGPNDCRLSDGLAFIDIQAAGGKALDGTSTRSPRPYTIITTGWGKDDAGQGIEHLGCRFAEHNAPLLADRVPGDALECWLLPVVTFSLDYLITPAGDWPPEPAGA